MRPTSIFGTPARATDMVGAAPSVSADDAASCMVMDESIFVSGGRSISDEQVRSDAVVGTLRAPPS